MDASATTIAITGSLTITTDLAIAHGGTGASNATDARANLEVWDQIAETTLGSAATSISLTGIPTRQDIRIVVYIPSSSAGITPAIRFNNDSGANYRYNISSNGGAAGQQAAKNEFDIQTGSYTSGGTYVTLEVLNVAANRKLVHGIVSQTTGVAGSEIVLTISGSWENTTAQIDRVDIISQTVATFAIGTRLTINAKRD